MKRSKALGNLTLLSFASECYTCSLRHMSKLCASAQLNANAVVLFGMHNSYGNSLNPHRDERKFLKSKIGLLEYMGHMVHRGFALKRNCLRDKIYLICRNLVRLRFKASVADILRKDQTGDCRRDKVLISIIIQI